MMTGLELAVQLVEQWWCSWCGQDDNGVISDRQADCCGYHSWVEAEETANVGILPRGAGFL